MQPDKAHSQNNLATVKKLTVTVSAIEERDKAFVNQKLRAEYKKTFGELPNPNTLFTLEKRSIDARHKTLKIHLRYVIDSKKSAPKSKAWVPITVDIDKRVAIVGLGPAGLAAALKLVEAGLKPILIERGSDIHHRKADIAKLCRTGEVLPNSNFAFGCGGAGAFSDGKLFTRSNKHTDIKTILETLVHFGADRSILTTFHAHIGSNKLPVIIDNIMAHLSQSGCKILCDTVLTGLEVKAGQLCAITTKSTLDNSSAEQKIDCDAVILATGHSASDVYRLLEKTDKNSLEAKPFAVGVRVEHPRALIDKIQWGENSAKLVGAEYSLKTQIDGRGVYTFCMCPGGVVVPAMSEACTIVTNGMSASARAGKWSNSAVAVEVQLCDIKKSIDKSLQEVCDKDATRSCSALDALQYREAIEKRAYNAVNRPLSFSIEDRKASDKSAQGTIPDSNAFIDAPDNNALPPCIFAPAQKLSDFLIGQVSEKLPATSFTPAIKSVKLDAIVGEDIARRLKAAFFEFDKKMKGFVSDEALLIAPETRTSSPIRILRDKVTMESTIKGLYPCGEGSGYSGGITTSAGDGVKAAEALLRAI